MSKDTIEQHDADPALNTDIGAISLAEGVMKIPAINNVTRELMSQLKSGLATRAGDVASATTTDLDASEGILSGAITGTTTIETVTLTDGRTRVRTCSAALPITAGVALIVDGATSGTTTFAAGDVLLFQGEAALVRVTKLNTTLLLATSVAFPASAPTVALGGASVGMSVTATLSYQKIGRLVHCEYTVIFTAKGTSTGALSVSLPFAALGTAGVSFAYVGAMTAPPNNLQGLVNGSSIIFYDGSTAIVDTDITNTTNLQFSADYLASS